MKVNILPETGYHRGIKRFRGRPMTQSEWIACADSGPMLEYLKGKATDRKLRLFACGCCRTVWQLITEGVRKEAILIAEQHVDGQASNAQLGQAISAVHRVRRKRNQLDWAVYHAVRYHGGVHYGFAYSVADTLAREIASESAPTPTPRAGSHFQGDQFVTTEVPPNADRLKFDATYATQHEIFSTLLRDIFGNPFRPIAADPSWLTSTVVSLAVGVYTDRAFDRMPILADALQDAGCENEDILNHCRQPGEHVRGCWALDLILDKK